MEKRRWLVIAGILNTEKKSTFILLRKVVATTYAESIGIAFINFFAFQLKGCALTTMTAVDMGESCENDIWGNN